MEKMIEQIIMAQQYILANPVHACVNTESSFVKQHLQKQGFTEAANLYWNMVCGGNAKIINCIIRANEISLSAKKFNMPAWGISGT